VIRQKIHEIWGRELQLEKFSDEDDFFALGGHSLIMTHVQRAIVDELGVEIGMDELFARPTVAEVSAHIEASRAAV
jgi:acyl carrier protein